MAEWLYEAGIGEARAALVAGGRLLEMRIEPDDGALRAGAVVAARVAQSPDGSGRARVDLGSWGEAWLVGGSVPAEGTRLPVEVVREALPEAGGTKPAQVRVAPAGAEPQAGPGLLARISAGGLPVRRAAPAEDAFEAHGWSEALEEAASGIVARPEAQLRLSLTPAMTLIDVDGAGAAPALAIAGAGLAGAMIRRFGIGGSIGLDLPTLPGKAERQAAAAALDAALPPPFERTAVNGFGFFQIVRRRTRASLPEQLAADPAGCAARALLRRAERAHGRGRLTLAAAPAVLARLEARPDWLAELARRTGVPLALSALPGAAISAGHAQYDAC